MARQTDLSVKLRIEAATQGLGAIQQIIAELESAGVATDEFRDDAARLSAELSRLGREQKLTENFGRLETELRETGDALEQAQRKVAFLRDGMEKAGAQGAKLFAKDLTSAKREVLSLSETQRKLTARLSATADEMRAAGLSTKNLADQQGRVATSIDRADREVGELTRSLQRARIGLQATGEAGQRAGRTIASELGASADGAARMRDAVNTARTQLLGLLGVVGAGQLAGNVIEAADAWANYTARLQLATDSAEELAKAEEELFRISQGTATDLGSNIELYNRLAIARKELNLQQSELLQLTESISQAFRVSGTGAEQAAAATLQLSQALASGVLRGDEFNSIMENGGRLAQALADGLDVPIGKLREMAQAGELTAERVTGALLGQADVIAAEYAKLPQTISGAVQKLSNAWQQFIGQTNESLGVTEKLAGALGTLADNFDEVADLAFKAGQLVVAAFAVKGVAALRAFAAESTAAGGALSTLATRAAFADKVLAGFGRTLASIGWVGIAYQIADITTNLVALYNQLQQQEQIQASLAATNERAATALAAVAEQTGIAFESMADFNQAVADGRVVFDEAAGRWRAAGEDLQQVAEGARAAGDALADAAQKIENVDVQGGFFRQLVGELQNLTDDEIPAFIARLGDLNRAGLLSNGMAESLSAQLRERMAPALGDVADEAGRAKSAVEGLTGAFSLTTAAEIDRAYRAGEITLQEYADAADRLVQSYIDQRKAARAAAGAVKDHGDAAESASDNTDRLVKATEDSNKEQSTAVSLTAIVRQRYAELSQAALDYFNAQMANVSSIKEWWTVLSDAEFQRVKARTEDYNASARATAAALRDGTASAAQLQAALSAAGSELSDLSEDVAREFRAAVDAAQAEIRRLEDSTASTLQRLEDEMDRLQGNDLAIAERAYQRERQELEAQYQQAVRSGNARLIADLQRALDLLGQTHQIKMDQLQAELAGEQAITDERQRRADIEDAPPAGTGPLIRQPLRGDDATRAGSGPLIVEPPRIDPADIQAMGHTLAEAMAAQFGQLSAALAERPIRVELDSDALARNLTEQQQLHRSLRA